MTYHKPFGSWGILLDLDLPVPRRHDKAYYGGLYRLPEDKFRGKQDVIALLGTDYLTAGH